MRPSLYLYPLLFCMAALAGCASTKDYESTAPKNLTIRAEVDSGGFFTSRGTQVGIYRISNKCPLEFLGSVDLEDKPVQVGLEIGRKTYLRFLFAQAAGRSSMAITWGTIITPRPGAQYVAKVRFADGMYEARVQEIGKGGTVVREFERQGLPCPEDD